ncbi:hypothetical protein SUGI_0057060 [Cryptomeria japonica]|nr:hypothetical protein SUGI_0057060 [Cryptomeria japonica]
MNSSEVLAKGLSLASSEQSETLGQSNENVCVGSLGKGLMPKSMDDALFPAINVDALEAFARVWMMLISLLYLKLQNHLAVPEILLSQR